MTKKETALTQGASAASWKERVGGGASEEVFLEHSPERSALLFLEGDDHGNDPQRRSAEGYAGQDRVVLGLWHVRKHQEVPDYPRDEHHKKRHGCHYFGPVLGDKVGGGRQQGGENVFHLGTPLFASALPRTWVFWVCGLKTNF